MADLSDPTLLQGFAPWAAKHGGLSGNWTAGLALFACGIVGAAITIFVSEAEYLPRIGEGARVKKAAQQRDEIKASLDSAMQDRRALIENYPTSERLPPVERWCDFLEGQLKWSDKSLARQRKALTWKLPLYVLLGGVVAVALAPTYLLAGVVGLAWPAVLKGVTGDRASAMVKQVALEALASAPEEIERTRANATAEAFRTIARDMRERAESRVHKLQPK